MGAEGKAVQDLVDVVARLRGPDGCPWDREQTHESLVPYLLEETYELAEALRDSDPEKVKEELGDLLLQVALHACIEDERGQFSLADVARALKHKLVRRHPHVFGSAVAGDAKEVRRRWEQLKRQEGSLPDLGRPALVAARKHLEAGGVTPEPPADGCLELGSEPEDPEATVGELLMQVVALARRWGVEPELALRRHLQMLPGRG
ncbi:MAG: MazG family protein [Candidatus Bipolaricaulota bacterium]